MTRFLKSVICAAFAGVMISSPAQAAAQLTQKMALRGDAPTFTLDGFGSSMATSGPWLFIGAPFELSSRGQSDGAVYIYFRSYNPENGAYRYMFSQKLAGTQTSVSDGDRFGAGVVAAADWLFVAAANNQDFDDIIGVPPDANSSAIESAGKVFAYRFEGESWNFKQELASNAPRTGGFFGASTLSKNMAVNTDASLLVIGEPINVTNQFIADKMHLFARNEVTWSRIGDAIEMDKDTATIDFHSAESIVWLGKHLVVKVRKDILASPDPDALAVSSQGLLYVYRAPLPSGFPSRRPLQIIDGVIKNDPGQCETVAGYGGMAAGGNVFAVTQPCLDTVNGAQTGRLDIYTYTPHYLVQANVEPTPLVLKRSIAGTIPNGRLGSTTHGGQESVAVSKDGRRILVGAAYGRTESTFPASAPVLLFEFQSGRWGLPAVLRPGPGTPPDGLFDRLFGQTVAFGENIPTHAIVVPAFVGEPAIAVENGPIGAVMTYEFRANGQPPVSSVPTTPQPPASPN